MGGLYALARHRWRQEDPSWDEALAENTVTCECNINNQPDPTCGLCDGCGIVIAEEPQGPSIELLSQYADFLEARLFVEVHGLAEWRALHGEPSGWFLDAMNVFKREWASLEHLERVAAAKRAKAKRKKS